MRFHSPTGRVFVRQSWLGDVMLCPERARLGQQMPNMRGGSDATIMGTAVHHAIERTLEEHHDIDADFMTEIALNKFSDLRTTEVWKETNIDPNKYEVFIGSMCESFLNDIYPTVERGGRTEYQFAYPLGLEVDGWAVWCEGTMDYVDPNGVVYDWKTASRAYNAREKQSTAIQPTVYAGAVVALGWSEFPVDFRYGVMIRQEKPRGQVVHVHRNESHLRWLKHTVKPLITNALKTGADNHWIMNDTHNLCSERWCSFWSVCKGAFCSPDDLAIVDITAKPSVESD